MPDSCATLEQKDSGDERNRAPTSMDCASGLQRDVSAVRISKAPWENIVPCRADWKAAAYPYTVYVLQKLILN